MRVHAWILYIPVTAEANQIHGFYSREDTVLLGKLTLSFLDLFSQYKIPALSIKKIKKNYGLF